MAPLWAPVFTIIQGTSPGGPPLCILNVSTPQLGEDVITALVERNLPPVAATCPCAMIH